MIQILHMELHYWFRLKNLCLIYDICMISLNTLEEFVKSENIFKGKNEYTEFINTAKNILRHLIKSVNGPNIHKRPLKMFAEMC